MTAASADASTIFITIAVSPDDRGGFAWSTKTERPYFGQQAECVGGLRVTGRRLDDRRKFPLQ